MKNLYELYVENDFVNEFSRVQVDDSTEEVEDSEVEPESEYKKPEPPEHIKLTVEILKRSLNFLPNKDEQRKILVLDILKFGVTVINNWEDELLPIVHLIWSPFIDRFKEYDNPLIINRSFDLLSVLAITSKDFIRQRTSKYDRFL